MSRPKIFGLGLAKTGTSSLAAALEVLGWTTIHDHQSCEQITADLRAGRRPDVSAADAFCDWPHPLGCIEPLGCLFPDALFILTVREEEPWIRSRLLHVLHSRVTGESCWCEADTAEWVREARAVRAEVEAWGERNPGRLLVYDVRDGWPPLSAFLGVPVPSVPFPRENGGRRRLQEILASYSSSP